jgi:hypothetical protein
VLGGALGAAKKCDGPPLGVVVLDMAAAMALRDALLLCCEAMEGGTVELKLPPTSLNPDW